MHIPEGFGTMFPYLFVDRAAKYIEFLENALGAVELGRTAAPDGRVANSRVKIGSTTFMVSESSEQMPATKGTFYLYVENSDSAMARALKHGAEKIFDPVDMPYGDRQGGIIDPAGNIWWVSQRLTGSSYEN